MRTHVQERHTDRGSVFVCEGKREKQTEVRERGAEDGYERKTDQGCVYVKERQIMRDS